MESPSSQIFPGDMAAERAGLSEAADGHAGPAGPVGARPSGDRARLDRDESDVSSDLAAGLRAALRGLPERSDRMGTFRIAVLASGDRDQPPGDPRPAPRRATGSRSSAWPPTSRRAGAGARRERRGGDGRVRRARTTATAATRDAAMADWLDGARASSSIVLAGYMELLSAGVRAPLPRTGSSTSTRRCCRRSRASTRSGRRSSTASGHRGHRPLRRRGRRLRADHPAAGGRGAIHSRPLAAGGRRSTRSSTQLLPEAIRLIAAGRVRVDAEIRASSRRASIDGGHG